MTLSVASGSTRTVASGSTVYANQVDLAGEINLTGQLTTDDGLAAASGTGDGTGTATSNPKALVSANGVGEGKVLQTEFENLVIASGTTRTVSSGSVLEAGSVSLAGELDLTGELRAEQDKPVAEVSYFGSASGSGDGTGTATALAQALFSASGSGDGTGSAVTLRKRLVSASGVGDGIAFDTENDRLLVESGTTDSVASSDVLDTGTLDLAGEVNLTGELQVEEAKPIALYGSFESASGIGEGLNYVFDFDPLTVASGDTFTVASGDTTRVGQVNLTGELNVSGDLQTVQTQPTANPQRLTSASGGGDGTGTAVTLRKRLVSATGIGEGFNYVFDSNPLSVSSTDTFTVASGDTTRVGEVELSGELNVSGELQVADVSATANPQRLTSASGIGEGVGMADALPRRLVSADGIGEGEGSAVYIIALPAVRGDSSDIEYHESDDLDLGADSDGTT